MLKRIRRRISTLGAGHRPDPGPMPAGAVERMAFAAELPIGQTLPLWRVHLQMLTEPHADGERLRLRAHLQTNLASALRQALVGEAPGEQPALTAASPGTSLSLVQRASGLAQRVASRALAHPRIRQIAEPLLRVDLNSWIEIQASSASLADGSHDLLPQSEKLSALGIVPRRTGDQPIAETWAGEAADGFAQVTVLQIDKRHLPERLRRNLGPRPFALAATAVSTAQQKP